MERRLRSWMAGLGAAAALAAGSAHAAGKTAAFDVAVVNTRPGVQVTVNSKVWVTETQARADVDNPGSAGQMRLVVTNGYFYQLDPQSKRYTRGPVPPQWKKSKDNFNLLLGRFAFDATEAMKHTKKVGTETVQGYVCDVQEGSETKGSATLSLKLWVPQKMEPKIPLKATRAIKVTEKGQTQEETTTVTLANLHLNQPIPASTFAIPAGYKPFTPPAIKGKAKKK